MQIVLITLFYLTSFSIHAGEEAVWEIMYEIAEESEESEDRLLVSGWVVGE